MDVTSVLGNNLTTLSIRRAAAAPALSRRTAETAPNAAQELPAVAIPPVKSGQETGTGQDAAQSSAARSSAPPNRRQDQGQVLPAASMARTDALPTSAGPHLRVDEDSKRIVAEFYDENGKVVRQIPPETELKRASNLGNLEGRLFDQSA